MIDKLIVRVVVNKMEKKRKKKRENELSERVRRTIVSPADILREIFLFALPSACISVSLGGSAPNNFCND